MNRSLALLGGALLFAACSFKAGAPASGQQEPAYVFPHAPHVEGDVACLACHAGVEKATALTADVRHVALPAHPSKEQACQGCHDTDPAFRAPARSSAFRVRFDHAAHAGRVKGCTACHQKLPEPGAQAPASPPMAACTACHHHQEEYAQARCTPCHVDLKGLSPETAFKHEGDWLRLHGDLARSAAETCAQCHDQPYCASCHATQTAPALPATIFPEEVTRSFIHRGDYVSRHAIDAGANPASCRRCHGSASCEACHAEQGVSAQSANARDPHPSGWLGSHGRAARRDVSRCAACHDNGTSSICVSCHQVGGPGGNPHPKSFTSKHGLSDVDHNSMCKACHTA